MAALDIAQNFRRALAMVGIVIRGSADEADTASPTISTGSGAPSSSEPPGSLYMRQSTTGKTTLYVTTASGTWVALPAIGLAAGAVFQSAETTATGSPQTLAHGLGSTPSLAWAVCTDSGATGIYTLVPATHDATNVSFNGTAGVKYRAYAIK